MAGLTQKMTMYAALACAAVVFSSCGSSKPTSKPHAKVAKPVYSAEEYVENLSVARLALAADAATVPTGNLDVIKAYHGQKEKTKRRTILLIEYKQKDVKKIQQIIAPVTISPDNNEFPSLLEVMTALNQSPVTLHNLHLLSTSVAPNKSFKLVSGAQTTPTLDQQQQQLLDHAQKLSPSQDVELQLRLVDFFIQHRFREAAYLSVDNVKQALADATENRTIDAATLSELSKKLEALESELHREMPFTLS